MRRRRILTVGWEPWFSDFLLRPVAERTGIEFVHGLVGDAARVAVAGSRFAPATFVSVSKHRSESLPEPDLELLASLESPGIPTVRAMIRGDRVLRHRTERESLGYATLLARRIRAAIDECRPDLVLASFDSIHSAMSLAVAKAASVPWVALTFPVIPDDLTGFCRGLTPDTIVPIAAPVDDALRMRARSLIERVRGRRQAVMAFRAPMSAGQYLRQYAGNARNLMRRRRESDLLGIDEFTYPGAGDRVHDIVRRTWNRIRLPAAAMITAPPAGRFAFFPLHMAPESSVDTWAPFYQDQLAFAAQVALAMPADVEFVVKLHFSDPDNYSRSRLQALLRLPGVRIAHPGAPGREFIDRATLVVGIQGTASLEAALLGKPVLMFGASPYLPFPRTQRAKRPDELHEQILGMLSAPPPTESEIVEAYSRYIAQFMPGRVNDWARPLEPEHHERFANCFRRLLDHIDQADRRARWYDCPPFAGSGADSGSGDGRSIASAGW